MERSSFSASLGAHVDSKSNSQLRRSSRVSSPNSSQLKAHKRPFAVGKACAKAKDQAKAVCQSKGEKSLPCLLQGVTFYSYKATSYFPGYKDRLKTIYSSSPSHLQCYMKAKQSSLLDVSLELSESQGAAGDGLLPSITALWGSCLQQSDFQMGIYIHWTPLRINTVYPLCISTVEILGGIKALFMVGLLLKIRVFGPDLQLA